jgi:SPP1 gp7 family putative phage head morphogenesis protein
VAVRRETLTLSRELRLIISSLVNDAVRSLVRSWATAWTEIEAEFAAAIDDLLAVDPGHWPTRAQIARATRAQAALNHALIQLDGLTEHTGVLVEYAGQEAVYRTIEWQPRIITSQLPPSAGDTAALILRFDRIDRDAIDAIIERVSTQVTAVTRPLSLEATDAMKRSLIRGVVVGDNPRTSARQMLARVQGAFNGGLTRALTIARTETLDAYRSGAAASQFMNEDVLTGWAWQAQLDTRTCPSCWAMHGSKHRLSETGPNDHQNGRCARLPLTKSWAELGFNIPEPPSLLPNAESVFRALSRDEQLAIVGPTRLAALDAGIPFKAMAKKRTTKGWRDSFVPRPASHMARATMHAV